MSTGNFLELVQTLQMAIKNLQMYTAAHPRSQGALTAAHGAFTTWLASAPRIHVAASASKIFVDGQPAEGASVHLGALFRQMSERQIMGFVVKRGASEEEIHALLQLFILKPAKIQTLGGPERVLADQGVRNVEITQTRYEVVREGEGGDDDGRGPAERPRSSPGEGDGLRDAPVELDLDADLSIDLDPQKLFGKWQEGLGKLLGSARGEGAASFKVNLAGLGGLAQELGLGDSFPSPAVVESLRKSLLALDPRSQLSVLASMGTLSDAPQGLRMALQALSGELFSRAARAMLAEGTPWEAMKDSLLDILLASPQREAMLTAFGAMLKASGLDPGRIQAMLQQLDWDRLSLESKIQKVQHEKGFYQLSSDQTLRFLQELLEKGRDEAFLRILDDIVAGMTSEDPGPRQNVAELLLGIAHWILDPGLPEGAEGALLDAFKGNFGWEPLPHIHHLTTEGLGALLASLVYRGELGQAQALFSELQDLVAFHDNEEPAEWRTRALGRLFERLCQDDLVDRTAREVVEGGADRMLTEFVPYLGFLGAPGAEGLVRRLAEEPDRHRRARIMEGIRATGANSLDSLRSSLGSSTWFLVRNALNLLGELGDASMLPEVQACLRHKDGRVRRAAVRAAWKLAGPAAEKALVPLLPQADPDTQLEVLFVLGQIRSAAAIPAVAALALDGRATPRIRLKAVEVLGQTAHEGALAGLTEILRMKGFSFLATPAESPELRLAAAKAMATIGTPAARAALKRAAEAAPKGPDRSALETVLWEMKS